MTEATPRAKPRTDTERHIREQARKLLVSQGAEAVTLRAIARELGITAPALYRYYDSREDLVHQICNDICDDLAAELTVNLAGQPAGDVAGQVFAICRLFRQWALTHPREFSLVFATPAGQQPNADPTYTSIGPAALDPFGRIFLGIAGPVMTRHPVAPPSVDVPAALTEDLTRYRSTLVGWLAAAGTEITPGAPGLPAMYAMFRFWVRLYGYVALEVFGRFPFGMSDPDAAFEAILLNMFGESGIPT